MRVRAPDYIRDIREADEAIQTLFQAVNNLGPENIASPLNWSNIRHPDWIDAYQESGHFYRESVFDADVTFNANVAFNSSIEIIDDDASPCLKINYDNDDDAYDPYVAYAEDSTVVWCHGVDTSNDNNFVIAPGTTIRDQNAFVMDTDGHTGINSDPYTNIRLSIEDLSLDAADDYYGLYVDVAKTAGATSAEDNDTMYGIYNSVFYDDAGSETGDVAGMVSVATLENGTIGSVAYNRGIWSFYGNTNIAEDQTVNGNIYGGWFDLVTYSGSTVTNEASGIYVNIINQGTATANGIVVHGVTGMNYGGYIRYDSGDAILCLDYYTDDDANDPFIAYAENATVKWCHGYDTGNDDWRLVQGTDLTGTMAFSVSSTTMTINALGVSVVSANGIDYNPGADVNVDIATVGVTGTPTFSWVEGESEHFLFNKDVDITGDLQTTESISAGTSLSVGTTSNFVGGATFNDYLWVSTTDGIDVFPGSDTDADLVTVGVTGTPKLWWDESEDSFAFSAALIVPSIVVNGSAVIATADGLDVNPGSDTDTDLITVGVAGTPRIYWDEGPDAFTTTHGVTANSLIVLNAATFAGATTISGAQGVDYGPGGDLDTDIATITVTGSPRFWWDESDDVFSFTNGINVSAASVFDPSITVRSTSVDPVVYIDYKNTDSAGDPQTVLQENSVAIWSYGMDTANSNRYVLTPNATVGGNTDFIMDTSGNVGVGTAPASLFHIYQNAASTSMQVVLEQVNSSGDVGIQYKVNGPYYFSTGVERGGGIGTTYWVLTPNQNVDGNREFCISQYGHIGINTAPSGSQGRLYIYNAETNSNQYNGMKVKHEPVTSANMNNSSAALNFLHKATVNNGVADAGYAAGVFGQALLMGPGTKADVWGSYIEYGNHTGAGTSTRAFGHYIIPYRTAGAIGTGADIWIAAASGAVVPTNDWCIYSTHAAPSRFVHDVRIDADSQYFKVGAGADAGITYDGTNLIINSRLVGSGDINIIGGDVKIGGSAGDNPTHALQVVGSVKNTLGSCHSDNYGSYHGDNNDAHTYFSGTNLVIDSDAQVAGGVDLNIIGGDVKIGGAADDNPEAQLEIEGALPQVLIRTLRPGSSTIDPILELYRDAAGDDDDALGGINFNGENDAPTKVTFAQISAEITDASEDTEAGKLKFGIAPGNLTLKNLLTVSTNGVGIGDDITSSHLLELQAADGEADNTYIAYLKNLESSDGRSRGVKIQAGTDENDYSLYIVDYNDSNSLLEVHGDGGIHAPNMKSGANQAAAGAVAGELWHDTDDNTVKMGI